MDTYGGTIIAFGDSDNSPSVRFLNRFISRNIRHRKRLDFVCLLGNTQADFQRLADRVDTTFVTVLGNSDRDFLEDTVLPELDPRIILPSLSFMEPREIEYDTDEFICVWGIDSVSFSNETAANLDAALTENKCLWNVMTTHQPLFSFGEHRLDAEVIKFRSLMLPLVKRHNIHLILAAHDRSTQVIRIEGSSAVLLVAGASTHVERGSISEVFPENVGARLLWHNDRINGLAIRVSYSRDSLVWEVVSVVDDDVLLTGLVNQDL